VLAPVQTLDVVFGVSCSHNYYGFLKYPPHGRKHPKSKPENGLRYLIKSEKGSGFFSKMREEEERRRGADSMKNGYV
jgi:hypothetical protein